MSEDPWAPFIDALHTAIQETMDRESPEEDGQRGGMLQSWVCVSTWIDEDGGRCIDVTVSNDMRLWEVEGLMEFAKNDMRMERLMCELDGHGDH